jgi:hypothetical protein
MRLISGRAVGQPPDPAGHAGLIEVQALVQRGHLSRHRPQQRGRRFLIKRDSVEAEAHVPKSLA